jgi:hypothetical protein
MSEEKDAPREPRAIQLIEDRWANVRHIAEAIAIIGAGLWAFYVFIYQEDIKPAGDPAALVVSIAIHRMGRDARRDILVVDTTFSNVGKTEIDIAADGFDLWGIRYGVRPVLRRTGNATKADISNDIPERSRTLIRASAELRAAAVGGPDRHIIMEPGSTQTIAETVVLARGAYDSLEAFVIALPVKTSSKSKVHVSIVRDSSHGLWLHGSGDWNEDDNRTEFALIP